MQGIPEDDLLRILSVQVPPDLKQAFAEMVGGMNHLDRALLAVSFSNAFHGGYSTAIEDLSQPSPRNLHMEYMNDKRIADSATTAAGPGGRSNHG